MQISEQEEERRGRVIAKVLCLTPKVSALDGKTELYDLAPGWGDRTALGLFRVVQRLVEDGA